MGTAKSFFVLFFLVAPVAVLGAQSNPASDSVPSGGDRLKTIVEENKRPENSLEIPTPSEVDNLESTKITGNWAGLRSRLLDRGVDLSVIYKGDSGKVLKNGVEDNKAFYLDNLDVKLLFDMEKLGKWTGGSIYLYGLANRGDDPTKLLGDGQGASNIENPLNAAKLYEAWVQQEIFDGKVSFLVGLHDLNSEFYVTDTSGLFINSSFGVGKEFSQTGVNGPSIFPNTSAAFRVKAEPSKSFYLQSGLFGAVAGAPISWTGALLIYEFAFLRGREDSKQLGGKYALGTWSFSTPFDHQAGAPAQGVSHGGYLLVDQAFSENVAMFFRYGVASTTVNRFGSCLGTGVVFTGLIPSRDKDRLGLGVARAVNGPEYLEAQKNSGAEEGSSAETTYEVSYRFEVVRGIAVQPDFQYIENPNTDPSAKPTSVAILRIEMSF